MVRVAAFGGVQPAKKSSAVAPRARKKEKYTRRVITRSSFIAEAHKTGMDLSICYSGNAANSCSGDTKVYAFFLSEKMCKDAKNL